MGEQKSIGPRVAKLIKEWLIDIDILEPNAVRLLWHRDTGAVPFREVVRCLKYHPSPLGAPVPAKVTSAWLALTAVHRAEAIGIIAAHP